MRKFISYKGFTLVELIIVIAIIAILAGAIFVAIDPARRLNESRNSRRSSDVQTILDAVKKYQADNGGSHYAPIAAMTQGVYYQIGTDSSGCAIICGSENTSGSCVNLSAIGSNYLGDVPIDPSNGTSGETGYALSLDSNGAITVEACHAQGEGPGGGDTPPEIKVVR